MLAGVIVLLAIGLMAYSQTDAFAWDEGFHMATAQLISRGKRPYLDFNFSQTPLNAYWNALWMLIFGQTWRTAHAVAAVMTTGAIFMTADFLYFRFPVPTWRFPVALLSAFAVGLNVLIVQFGTIGQAYAFCLFLIVAAFRATISAVDRQGLLLPALAGFLSSARRLRHIVVGPGMSGSRHLDGGTKSDRKPLVETDGFRRGGGGSVFARALPFCQRAAADVV